MNKNNKYQPNFCKNKVDIYDQKRLILKKMISKPDRLITTTDDKNKKIKSNKLNKANNNNDNISKLAKANKVYCFF